MNLEQYRLIVESSPNMIWRSNLTTECDYFNKTWLQFTGRTMEQEVGFGWAEGVHPEDFDRCVKIYMDNFAKQHPFEMDYRLKRHDGEYRWINDRGVPFYDRKGTFIGFIGSCMDVTEKIEGQLLKKMAQEDFLCGTFTRQYCMLRLTDLFEDSKKTNTPLSVMMMDINAFKSINDKHGHSAGDLVLKKVASAIQSQLSETDIFGRYGGDEFVIGLIGQSPEGVMNTANLLLRAVAETEIEIPQSVIHVTISIGIKNRTDEKSLDELIHAADMNLYQAKKKGKNLVVSSPK